MEPKHLKITESGFENMTGLLGDIEFENGVSVGPLTPFQASRISSAMRAEFVDGTNSSPAGLLVSEREAQAPVVEKLPMGVVEKPLTGVEKYLQNLATQKPKSPKYSQEQLEAIADKDGIAALRVIGEEFKVKATSIPKLIQAILKAQG